MDASPEASPNTSAHELLVTIREELAPEPGANRLVPLIAEGRFPREGLARIAGEQYRIIPSDRRSLLFLAARFPEPPAGEFFTELALGENVAFAKLLDFAEALHQSEQDLGDYEPQPGCQAYPAFVAWLALNGDRADVAIALVANFAAWGDYCRSVAQGLRQHYELDDEACGFFDFFAAPTPEIDEKAVAVVEASMEAGTPPQSARRIARLVQAYELSFWNTLADTPTTSSR